jgi:hypothetical protein
VLDPDYQTNGGVVLALGVQLAHLVEPPPRRGEHARASPGARRRQHALPRSPRRWVIKGKPVPLASAVYRLGKPPKDVEALAAKRDGKGRRCCRSRPQACNRPGPGP